MENCMENARVLKEGIEKTGKFDILSKDVGVPLVAFSLKDGGTYTVFEISESLRRFGWIVPAYTMPPNAEHVAVLRVVIREDFSRSLAERLVTDLAKVLAEFDVRASRVKTTVAHVTTAERSNGDGDATVVKKSVIETQREITAFWRKLVDRKKTSGVC